MQFQSITSVWQVLELFHNSTDKLLLSQVIKIPTVCPWFKLIFKNRNAVFLFGSGTFSMMLNVFWGRRFRKEGLYFQMEENYIYFIP